MLYRPCGSDFSVFHPQTYLPLDLRVKKTRAIRRRLTKAQVRHAEF